MKTFIWIKGLSLFIAGLICAVAACAEPVRVFAAASLQGPLDRVAADWDGAVTISYGGSGAIARQISQGAPADVVILANPDWADWLLAGGHITRSPRPLLSNSLVIIGPAGAAPLDTPSSTEILARLDGGRLAMGQHQSVPAGIYAQAWMAQTGLWDVLRPHLAETENVRAALALVSRRETPLGIVYRSDAQASDAVAVVHTIPQDAHPPILYPGLALNDLGEAFLDHVTARRDDFVAAGFDLP